MNNHYVNEEEVALIKEVGEKLIKNKMLAGTAESCTGGRIASMITSIPKSSDHFVGGIISYSEEIKKEILKVPVKDIDEYGAVSQIVVEKMAKGATYVLGCDCVVATSGIAGPDGGSQDKPVGTVWIATVVKGNILSKCFYFEGDRQEIVQQSSHEGLRMLSRMLP